MKKINYIVPLFASALLFGACSPNGGNVPNIGSSHPLINETTKASNLYAFQAATSIGLVANMNVSPKMHMAVDNTKENTESIVDTIKSYLPAVEAALTGLDAISSSEEVASDREGYETKLVISYKDIAFKDTTFTMYYNETGLNETTTSSEETSKQETSEEVSETTSDQSSEETLTSEISSEIDVKGKIDDDEDDDEKEVKEKEDETEDDEQESQINGIILVDDKEYEMHGEKEFDGEEYEVSFSYYVDEETLITVEQEIEQGEQEFEYSIVKGDETIYEYSLELENNEVELETKEAGKVENVIEFELVTKDDQTLIKAKIVNGDDKNEYTFKKVVNENNEATYELI